MKNLTVGEAIHSDKLSDKASHELHVFNYEKTVAEIWPHLSAKTKADIERVEAGKPLPELAVGDYCKVHPATDLFMRGVVYATVKKVGRNWLTLRHGPSRTNHKVSKLFAAQYLEKVN